MHAKLKLTKACTVLLLLIAGNCCFAQDFKKTDSLRKVLDTTKSDADRIHVLHELSYNYMYSKVDSCYYFGSQGLALAKKTGNVSAQIRSMNDIANAFTSTGNFTEATSIFLEALQKAEKIGDEKMRSASLGNLAECYNNQGEYRQAIQYTYQSLAIDLANRDTAYLLYDYINLGDYFQKFNLPDSALPYINLAYQLALKTNDVDLMGGILINFADLHKSLKNMDLSLVYYRKGIENSEALGNDELLNKAYFGLSELFASLGQKDSSLIYLKKCYITASKVNDRKSMLDAAAKLATVYENQNNDSTLKYLKISVVLKDSIFNMEKIKQVQNLTVNERLRQDELAELRTKQEAERKNNLQLMGIAAFIPLFFGTVLLVGRKRSQSRSIRFMGLLGLLLLFEFISLFVDPYIAHWTNHSPILMLFILVAIAALLVPTHHRLERALLDKLAHKQKAVVGEAPVIMKETE